MIRLPPTSISLSEIDIQFHMQQAEIYQGLVRQGFDKQDISRYLEDYRKSALPDTAPSVPVQLARAPSTLDFACRPKKSRPSPEAISKIEKNDTGQQPVSFESDMLAEDAKEPSGYAEHGPILVDSEDDTANASSPSISPAAMPPKCHSHMHAPRQSSLLRFSTAVSPDRHSNASQGSEVQHVPTSLPARRYRPRSQTDPYISSEKEHSSADISEHILGRIAQLSVDDGVPLSYSSDFGSDGLSLPSPPSHRHGTLRRRPSTAALRTNIAPAAGAEGYLGNNPDASKLPSTLLRSQSSDLLPALNAQNEFPSSPPAQDSSLINPSTPPLAEDQSLWPATPITARRTAPMDREEDEDHGPRYLDGSSFSVYNDSLPTISQPQTPADLSRTRLITEREAAYTAPPGMIRFGSVSTAMREPSDAGGALGQESPTLHAITMRERRSRQLWRSMRVEGARMRRNRLRDQELLDETTPGSARARRRQRQLEEEPWRDELDADRVGEENFETNFTITPGGVMRVVSGNANRRGED